MATSITTLYLRNYQPDDETFRVYESRARSLALIASVKHRGDSSGVYALFSTQARQTNQQQQQQQQ